MKTKRRNESENWNETIELAWLLSANNESFYFPWYRRFQIPHEARSKRCITVLTKRKMSINLMTQIMYYHLLHVKRNDNTTFQLSHFSVVVDVVQCFSSTNWHHKRRNTNGEFNSPWIPISIWLKQNEKQKQKNELMHLSCCASSPTLRNNHRIRMASKSVEWFSLFIRRINE